MYPNQYCNPCNEPEPCVPAPPPPDCVGEPCEEIVLDTCVRYTGPAIPCLGIETGTTHFNAQLDVSQLNILVVGPDRSLARMVKLIYL